MTAAQPSWDRIPFDLRERRQWLLASPDSVGDLKVPTTIDASGNLFAGSSTDRSTWLHFDQAVAIARQKSLGLGYCIAHDDPFTCIDLDVKGEHNEPDPAKWSTQAQLDRFWFITQAFDTYTELSQSGKGLHVWTRGKTEAGARHDHIEVYARDRFMVCTGNILFDKPIEERQPLLDRLVAEIRFQQGASRKVIELDETAEVYTDDEIFTRAAAAENGVKFKELCEGRWQQYKFPSQSEGDLALMSMFTFYSRSNEQCRRLFRLTRMGGRSKSLDDDRYLDYTLKLIRGRQAHEDKLAEASMAAVAPMIDKMINGHDPHADARAYAATLGPATPPTNGTHYEPNGHDHSMPGPLPPTAHVLTQPPSNVGKETSIPWPPGFAGSLAGFIYRSAPRPVKEVAIVASLGWLAGVCGKMWNIPGSGLNIYLILVARSAIGKEAMHSGLSALLAKLRESVPSAQEFVDFSDFASGPALVKACAANPSFVNVAGEWGKKLRRMSQDGDRDGPMQQLRTVMTNLYQKSGPASIVGGLTYSTKENNVASVTGVAYSMIGETTPGTFYDALTETMMEDGFLSRFTVVEYAGERPAANHNPELQPDNNLVEQCIQIMMHSKTLIGNRAPPVGVSRTPEAAALMLAFDQECDTEINKTDDESWRQMWNRAALKMMRIAALLAVGDNCVAPCITEDHTRWALDLIRRDIHLMRRRVESGDVGLGDGVRERKLITVIKEYFERPLSLSYKVPEGMREKGIFTRSYLHIRIQKTTSFLQSRNGATKALDDAIRSLVDSGYIAEVDKAKSMEDFAFTGKCYRIISLPNLHADHK